MMPSIIMFALLTVELNTCEGLACPLNLGFLVYLIIAVISCCCCYPGSCAVPQNQRKKNIDGEYPEEGALDKFEFFGSIGDVLNDEMVADDIASTGVINPIGATAMGDVNLLRKRNKGIKY